MDLTCDGVFQGGGVKGAGFVGAVCALENAGYKFENVAGTSAGAIIAALIAAGYSSNEMEDELKTLDFNDFKQENLLDKFGVFGKTLSIIFNYGAYNGNYFERWMENILYRKGIKTFGDLHTTDKAEKYIYKFQAIASDLTTKKMLLLPRDIKQFGIEPDNFSVAKAVRMSMSIPIFFEPVRIKDCDGCEHIIVDGGLLSNYPIWILDDGTKNPEWPTFGFKFINNQLEEKNEKINNIVKYISSVISTLLEGRDNFHISESKGDFQRTVTIPTIIKHNEIEKNINSTYFNITPNEKHLLYLNGKSSAEIFLSKWNFDEWKRLYRKNYVENSRNERR